MKKKSTSTNTTENIDKGPVITQHEHYGNHDALRSVKSLPALLLTAGVLFMASCKKPDITASDTLHLPSATSLSGINSLEVGSVGTLQVFTIAGNAIAGYVDGTGTAAQFNLPSGIATDASGNVYVADMANHRIRKITAAGVVSVLAGSGAASYQEGTGTAASLNTPSSVATDAAGNVYVADKNNHLIRKITPAGTVSTLAGGAGIPGNAEGPGSAARFSYPAGVAVDGAGNILVADSGNHKIRKITSDGFVSTFAGNGTRGTANGPSVFSQFNGPVGVTADASGNVFVADAGNHKIRKISGGLVSTLAGGGAGDEFGFVDETGVNARFNNPTGVVADGAGNVYVADKFNHAIRQISSSGAVTTLSGNSRASFVDGVVSVARFSSPAGIAMDAAGKLFIADQNNYRIRELGFLTVVSTLAGDGVNGFADGPGTVAEFGRPTDITKDAAGNIYVADGVKKIRKITPSGFVSTYAGCNLSGYLDGPADTAQFYRPEGIASDAAGNIYVVDGSTVIRKISPTRIVTTIAGVYGSNSGSIDGPLSVARFNHPKALAVDAAGVIYVTDYCSIRKITTDGQVITIAGKNVPGYIDGESTAAAFNSPDGLALDAAGNIYVADAYNHRIRKVTPAGVVTTVGGSGPVGFSGGGNVDGSVSIASFNSPSGVAVDAAGNIYVADAGNSLIRMISPAGNVSTVAGSGPVFLFGAGYQDGLSTLSKFSLPGAIVLGPSGLMYVCDTWNNRIRKLQ